MAVGGGGLFVEVGLMLVEGRLGQEAKGGMKQGPHCPQIPNAPPSHQCSAINNLCQRAEALRRHMSLMNENSVPMCIDVFLCPECSCGQARAAATNICSVASSNDLLLEQWTVSFLTSKPSSTLEVDGKGLLQAIRSQLHFSQLSAWYSLGKVGPICYRLSHPNTTSLPPFSRPPIQHNFPIVADQSRPSYLKVSLKSLPRLENVPVVSCSVHSNPSPLASTVTAFKTVFHELGQCLLDPPSRVPPLKQGFLAWRDKKNQGSSQHQASHSRNLNQKHGAGRSSLGVVDDRMLCGCKHIGKHHCEDDVDQDFRTDRSPLIINGCAKERTKNPSSPNLNNDLNNRQCDELLRDYSNNRCNQSLGLNVLHLNITNPLKRKRQQICHNSKKLLFEQNVRSDSKADSRINQLQRTMCLNSDLVDGFRKLDIHDVTIQPPQVNLFPPRSQVPFPCPPSPKPFVPRKSWTDSSSEDTECESPVSKEILNCLQQPSHHPQRFFSRPLLGNFEENLLKGRLKPCSVVEGFTADIGASGSFCPKHQTLPVVVSYFPPQGLSTPILGSIRLSKKGYTVPRFGTIQVTVLNPLGTVVKMFVVGYNLSEMPANSQTFIRQKIVSNESNSSPLLRYLIHLRFSSSKSGRIFLDSEIQMIICRQYDVDATLGADSESNSHLQSTIISPLNPNFSPKK